MIALRALEDGDADDLFRWRSEREVEACGRTTTRR